MTPSCYAPEEVFGAVVGNKTISADGTVDPRLDESQLSDELTPKFLKEHSTDLVDGEPSLHTVSIPFETQFGVSNEIPDQLPRVACSKAAISLVQSERRIVVMKSDCWFDANGNEAIDLAHNKSGIHQRAF